MKVLHVVGARPNFMKTAPIMAEMGRDPGRFVQTLVHTGQHYDCCMSSVFLEQLGLPEPDYHLEVGSGSHAEQTARTMVAFEKVVETVRPDLVVVVGDVNSTLACALVTVKFGIPLAHVEAGLRSRDRSMPEEINRVLTDQLADFLLTPSRDANDNLRVEGICDEKIYFVGNVMVDTLVRLLPQAQRRNTLRELGVDRRNYVLVTLHRPANVDDRQQLEALLKTLEEIGRVLPVVFPLHPRTRAKMISAGLGLRTERVHLIDPMSYLDFVCLMSNAAIVLTDSGGVQEETCYLGVPCLTARPNTERPITITCGTNRLVAADSNAIVGAVRQCLTSTQHFMIPEYWDGHAAERVVEVLRKV